MKVKIKARTEEKVKYIPTATINKDEVRDILTAYFEESELAEKYRLVSISFETKPLRVSDEWGMNDYLTYTFEGVTFEMEENGN